MAIERKRIGVLFHFSPKWMGGVIYVLNIVKVLDFLQDEDKPEIFLIFNSNLKRFVDELNYPYLHKIERNYPPVYSTFVKSILLRKNLFVDDLINQYKLETIFPLHDFPVKSKPNCKLISWFADLQHLHYPSFFSYTKRAERYLRMQFILKNSNDLVVSSNDVKSDFYRFFKIPKQVNVQVYNFVSIIDKFPTSTKTQVCEEFKLPGNYFVISNQFHKHKNHKVALQAVSRLKKQGKIIHLAITGKLPDDTQSIYVADLRKIIEENDLHNQITFLGVLPRDKQLSIMFHADAILQPSLFEGWSTVIEDAISLQKPVICSNLAVNVEQLKNKGIYFSPHDDEELSELLISRDFSAIATPIYESYEQRVTRAASTLLGILT